MVVVIERAGVVCLLKSNDCSLTIRTRKKKQQQQAIGFVCTYRNLCVEGFLEYVNSMERYAQ